MRHSSRPSNEVVLSRDSAFGKVYCMNPSRRPLQSEENSANPSDLPVIFVSYSHQDAKWLHRLRQHLGALSREFEFEEWDDTKIGVGDDWEAAIKRAIQRSRVAILLVTADYLASPYVSSSEIPLLLQARLTHNVRILWVLVSPVWFAENDGLASIQAFNSTRTPLTGMSRFDQDALFANLAKEVSEIVGSPAGAMSMALPHPNAAPTGAPRQWDVNTFPRHSPDAPRRVRRRKSRSTVAVSVPAHFSTPSAHDAGVVAAALSDDLKVWLRKSDSRPTHDRSPATNSNQWLPPLRQWPVIGVLLAGCKKIYDWVEGYSDLWNNESFRHFLLVALLLSAGVLPPFVVHARRHDREIPHLGWLIVLFFVIGGVAVAGSTVLGSEYKSQAAAAAAARDSLSRMLLQHPMEFQKLESLWAQLSDEERARVDSVILKMRERVPRELRLNLGGDVEVFARARFDLTRRVWLTAVLTIATLLVGLENVICSLMLAWSWLTERRPSFA